MGYKLFHRQKMGRAERHHRSSWVRITMRLTDLHTHGASRAFAVGLVSNLYSRIFSGNAFVVMVCGPSFF